MLGKKNGQFLNYFVLIAFLVTMGFISVMALHLYDSFIISFNATGYYGAVAQDASQGFRTSILMFDNIILLMLAALLIGIGYTSYRLRSHPMFFIVTIIYSAIFGAVSYFFNYIFAQLVSQPVLSTAVLSFPKTMILCTNLHWVALAAIVIGSITLYAKRQSDEVNYVQ